MSTLLDDVIEQYRAVASPLGETGPTTRPIEDESWHRDLAPLKAALAPLTIPAELIEFWQKWLPNSFGLLAEANVHFSRGPGESLEEWRHTTALEYPRILLPFLEEERRTIAVELVSDDHAGCRTFEIDYHGDHLTMLGVGVADMVDLFQSALAATNAMTEPSRNPGPIDWHIYGDLWSKRVDEVGKVRVEHFHRAQWPKHWLAAEGMNEEWLKLKGPTHTIAEFNAERTTKPHLKGILHGRWRTAAGGGPLDGVVGHLSDDTGSLQLFIPNDCPEAGFGPDRWCEVEVSSSPRAGTSPSSLPRTWGDIQDGLSQDEAARIRFHSRLDAAMQNLDVSIHPGNRYSPSQPRRVARPPVGATISRAAGGRDGAPFPPLDGHVSSLLDREISDAKAGDAERDDRTGGQRVSERREIPQEQGFVGRGWPIGHATELDDRGSGRSAHCEHHGEVGVGGDYGVVVLVRPCEDLSVRSRQQADVADVNRLMAPRRSTQPRLAVPGLRR